jgi:hypothetical protein
VAIERRRFLMWAGSGLALVANGGPAGTMDVMAAPPAGEGPNAGSPRGRALCIGLNGVDPAHYDNWKGSLRGAESDAEDIEQIARVSGLRTQRLLTGEATRAAVQRSLTEAAEDLRPGDLFVLYYAGCGGKLPDDNDDEPDAEDETWCLFDAQFTDDELAEALGRFKMGVRVLMITDTCNLNVFVERSEIDQLYGRHKPEEFRTMPPDLPRRIYRKNRERYDEIIAATRAGDNSRIDASVIGLTACQDNQLALDGITNGLFTAHLKYVWDKGRFSTGHRSLLNAVLIRMPPTQSPGYVVLGNPYPEFERQKAFTL